MSSTLTPTQPRTRPADHSLRRRLVVGGLGAAVLLSVAHAANDALTTIVSVLLPTVQERFGLGETMLATLVATMWVSGSLSQPFVGVLTDKVDRRAVASIGVLLSAVLLSLFGVVPAVWLLFLLIVVGGLGSAAVHPAGAVIARTEAHRRPKLAISLFAAGGQLGFAVGPVIVLGVVAEFGITATPWLMIPGVVLAVLLYVLLPAGRDDHRSTGPAACARCLLYGPVAILAVGGVLSSLVVVAVTSALPLWLVNEVGRSTGDAVIGWSLATFSFGAVAGSLSAGLLSGRVPRLALTAGTMVLATAPLYAVLVLPVGSVGYFVVLALAGALVYANFPILVATAQELAPHSIAAASGVLMGLAPGAAGVLYIGVGAAQTRWGIANALGLTFLALFLAAAVTTWVLVRNRERLSLSV
ncbi:MFS transporter [Spiractinospora alimapuensis]|uniref:MFS transporter n=1 Tax=Spiractinospora alimapuensis TaxID=2820884 RepID=UPI001F311F28|nr:MFS transporter [Spiractinospora alimapuensis]QVQ54555.1 MFS transporter [Spiractinospora alimapuensis]